MWSSSVERGVSALSVLLLSPPLRFDIWLGPDIRRPLNDFTQSPLPHARVVLCGSIAAVRHLCSDSLSSSWAHVIFGAETFLKLLPASRSDSGALRVTFFSLQFWVPPGPTHLWGLLFLPVRVGLGELNGPFFFWCFARDRICRFCAEFCRVRYVEQFFPVLLLSRLATWFRKWRKVGVSNGVRS